MKKRARSSHAKHPVPAAKNTVTVEFTIKNGNRYRIAITPTENGFHQNFCCFPRIGKTRYVCECHKDGKVSRAEGSCAGEAFCDCTGERAVLRCGGKTFEGSDPKPEFEQTPG